MKNPKQLLTLLITQWNFCMAEPLVCKTAMFRPSSFGDKFVAACIRAVIIARGDWRAAAEFLDATEPKYGARIRSFRQWAASLTAPRKRGLLLEWKGGAS